MSSFRTCFGISKEYRLKFCTDSIMNLKTNNRLIFTLLLIFQAFFSCQSSEEMLTVKIDSSGSVNIHRSDTNDLIVSGIGASYITETDGNIYSKKRVNLKV